MSRMSEYLYDYAERLADGIERLPSGWGLVADGWTVEPHDPDLLTEACVLTIMSMANRGAAPDEVTPVDVLRFLLDACDPDTYPDPECGTRWVFYIPTTV